MLCAEGARSDDWRDAEMEVTAARKSHGMKRRSGLASLRFRKV